MMCDYAVDRADPNRERRPVLNRTAAAARRFVLSCRGGDQSETIQFEFESPRSLRKLWNMHVHWTP